MKASHLGHRSGSIYNFVSELNGDVYVTFGGESNLLDVSAIRCYQTKVGSSIAINICYC